MEPTIDLDPGLASASVARARVRGVAHTTLIALCALAAGSCNSAVREGGASTGLVIEQLNAASGADDTTFANVLQSDVVTFPFAAPGVTAVPSPLKETWDFRVNADLGLVDPTSAPRREVERSQLRESQARVRVALFGLRQEVNEAFFAAALLQAREGVLAAAITDLEARLRAASARVEEGAALPGEAAAVEATLLQRRQDRDELSVDA